MRTIRLCTDSSFSNTHLGHPPCDDPVFTIYDLLFTIHGAMTNEEIARRFNQMASLMEVRGEDPFRLRSYRMAAEAIETWPTPMADIARGQGLAGLLDIPGVGKALAGKI